MFPIDFEDTPTIKRIGVFVRHVQIMVLVKCII